MFCQGRVYFGSGEKRRFTNCSRRGYREVNKKMYCFLHAEREKARIAIRSLKKITSYIEGLTDDEAEGVPGMATGEAIYALEAVNERET